MFDKSDIAPLRASLPSVYTKLPTKSPARQKHRSLKELRPTFAAVSGEAIDFKPPTSSHRLQATDAGTKIALAAKDGNSDAVIALLPKNNAELTRMLQSTLVGLMIGQHHEPLSDEKMLDFAGVISRAAVAITVRKGRLPLLSKMGKGILVPEPVRAMATLTLLRRCIFAPVTAVLEGCSHPTLGQHGHAAYLLIMRLLKHENFFGKLDATTSEAVSTLIRGVMTKRLPAIEQPSMTDAAAAAPSDQGRVPEQQTPPERPTSSEAASAKRPRGQAPPLAPAPADKRPRTTTLLNFFKPKEVVDVKAAETRSIAETSAAHGGANDSAHDGTRDSGDRGGGSGGNGARASGGAIGAGGASGAGGANGAGGSSGLGSSSAIPSVVTGSNSRLATRPNGKQPMAPLRIDPNPDIRPADMSPYFFKKMREDAEKLELQVAQEKERRQAEQRPLLQATPAAAAAPLASGHWRQKTLEDAANYGDTHALLSGVTPLDWCKATQSKKRPDEVARLPGAIRTRAPPAPSRTYPRQQLRLAPPCRPCALI